MNRMKANWIYFGLFLSFEQYADDDPPVRMFSSGVRKRLVAIGAEI
jgi:hypothetical protein